VTTYDEAIGYDAAIPYDGGALGAVVDRMPSRNLRFEVAFATGPDDPAPAWVDLSDRVHLPSGITVRRGRGDEFDTVQTGVLNLSLENIDGALSPDNPSSPYYPNVLPQRRCRLTYRDPATYGTRNMLAAEDASFEGGTVGAWGGNYFGAPAAVTLTNSTTHPSDGTKGALITWPTAAGSCAAVLFTPRLVIGRRYTFRVVVWNAPGTPAVNFGDIFGVITAGQTSTTTGAFETLTFSWVATQNQPVFGIKSTGATTAGQQTWFDAVMIDETPVGTTLGAFTTLQPTDTAQPVVLPRFDGYIERWPITWPDGGQTYARSAITASDLQARLGDRQKLRSVVVETIALDGPVVHFPLGEPADSTTVSSITESSTPATLDVHQVSGGGKIAFAEGTGTPTDGIAAPIFTPTSSSAGACLFGRGFLFNYNGSGDVTLEAAIASTGTSSTAVAIFDGWGSTLSIELDGSGRVVGRYVVPLAGVTVVATSASSFNNGTTVNAAASLSLSGGTVTLELTVNGSLAATASTTAARISLFTGMSVGGLSTGSMFTGTISHVVVFPSYLTPAKIAQHRTAQATGFAGERSDQRLARVAAWIGLPAERCAFDVGNSSTVGHIDTTGLDPLTYMRKIEATEAGLLFAGADGRLTFHNRARSYANTAPALTIPSSILDEGAGMAKDLQLVVNDVTGQRQGGATVRLTDDASVAAYGPLTDSIDIVSTSDDDVAAAVAWRVNMSSRPLTRFSDLVLDGFTDATYSPQIRRLVDIGARVELTDMPSQAPASTMRQAVQGYTETITDSQWLLSVNATPYAHLIALVLDDPVLGALDSYPLAY
jgi:hypothetical protein